MNFFVKSLTPKSTYFIALLLGLITVLGFAPFYLFPIPILSLALLFRLWWISPSSKQTILIGYFFGLGFFGLGVSWVYVSIHDFGGMPLPLAVLATILFCAFLSLFTALAGFLQSLFKTNTAMRIMFIMPTAWVLLEWTRGWILTGFPWIVIGYSQVPYSLLSGYAPLLGIYGVSLMTAISAGLLCVLFTHDRKRPAAIPSAQPIPNTNYAAAGQIFFLILLWALGWLLQQYHWTQPKPHTIDASLLQGNIPQDLKWHESTARYTMELYLKMSLASRGRLIILPETALPLFYDEVPADYLNALARHARDLKGDIILGIPERIGSGGANKYYNSVISLGASPHQLYRKYHLVPFGEYIPLDFLFGWIIKVLHIPLSDFNRGPVLQAPINASGERLAIAICYEDAFGEELINQLPQATVLVNVSNDAWFGSSFAPHHHLQMSQARALETGRYMLRATNTGVTAIIDNRGFITRQIPQFVTGALDGKAQPFTGSTPYIRWGNSLALILMSLIALVGLIQTLIFYKRTSACIENNKIGR